jgi:hypothetical protein
MVDPVTLALIGGAQATGFASSLIGNKAAKEQASKQRKWDWHNARNQHRYAADDLEKAGLNRVLALGNPSSTPPAPSPKLFEPDLVKSGLAAASARQQIAQSKAVTAAELNRAKLLEQQTIKTGAEAAGAQFDKALKDALLPVVKDTGALIRDFTQSSAKSIKKFDPDAASTKVIDWLMKSEDQKNQTVPTSGSDEYIQTRRGKRKLK